MVTLPTSFEVENKRNSMSTASTIPATQSNPQTTGGSTVVLSAKENEWVAPQFHRKVHVNNRIYIEGAGIEKLGYERLTDYFSRWGKVYNVELKVNNRDGRRQKKVYGFVTFSEENDAQACIDAAKAGIEIEPGRPLSVRAAFFMPRRNSFESENVSHKNWQNSSAPSEPTIHSRSPSPDFPTGEWKPEMANQVNGHYKPPMTIEEQAKKLFEIFQNLPEHAQHRILEILITQKNQEQQLAAIKESRNQLIDDLSNGNVPSQGQSEQLSGLFGNLHLNNAKLQGAVANGGASRNTVLEMQQAAAARAASIADNGFAQNGYNGNAAKGNSAPPISLPRYVSTQERSSNGNAAYAAPPLSQSQSVMTPPAVSQQQPVAGAGRTAPQYARQYSDSVFEQNNGYQNSFGMTQSRPIKKIHNENALSLNIPDTFGANSPSGAWTMPNSPPNDDFFMAPGRPTQRLTDSFSQY
jgi:hypothetical protein